MTTLLCLNPFTSLLFGYVFRVQQAKGEKILTVLLCLPAVLVQHLLFGHYRFTASFLLSIATEA